MAQIPGVIVEKLPAGPRRRAIGQGPVLLLDQLPQNPEMLSSFGFRAVTFFTKSDASLMVVAGIPIQ